jgi:hypothetical protein
VAIGVDLLGVSGVDKPKDIIVAVDEVRLFCYFYSDEVYLGGNLEGKSMVNWSANVSTC